VDPLDILGEFYEPGSRAYKILVEHGKDVAGKSMEIAEKVSHLDPDMDFLKESAMLHRKTFPGTRWFVKGMLESALVLLT